MGEVHNDLTISENKGVKGWWKKKTKRGKIWSIIWISIFALGIAYLITLLFARNIYGDEIADQILGKGVPNGFVAIWNSITRSSDVIIYTVATIVIAIIAFFLVSFLTHLFTSNSTKRIQTTGSIIKSLCRYAIIIIAGALLLTKWGVNVTGVVASLGILTLVIGLGCQTLINDIISGLFIVFDDYFSVGDMVIIDGFRGYVKEIGLRAIKIDDTLGNIKAINNSSITSVVNLSRSPNYIVVKMDVSYYEDIERLEAIFARELPKIKARLPQLIDGPWYKGVDNFDDGRLTFNFAFTTKCDYRFQATRDFKRELFQIFKENDIFIPYDQITINQQDNREFKVATSEDKKIANELNKVNRAKMPEYKRKKLSAQIAEAYNKTISDDVNK